MEEQPEGVICGGVDDFGSGLRELVVLKRRLVHDVARERPHVVGVVALLQAGEAGALGVLWREREALPGLRDLRVVLLEALDHLADVGGQPGLDAGVLPERPVAREIERDEVGERGRGRGQRGEKGVGRFHGQAGEPGGLNQRAECLWECDQCIL